MTIDEAIKEFTECAKSDRKQQNYWAAERDETSPLSSAECVRLAEDCETRAEYNEQLAEWLTELKELRNSIGAVKLKDMKDAVKLLSDLDKENTQLVHQLTEAKWLLKAAVEDLNATVAEVYNGGVICASCKWINDGECCCPDDGGCDTDYRWRYTDEALKLIE